MRKVDHISGIINSIAGGSSIGYSGDSGIATYAVLTNPYQVALDTAGNIYISDYGNNRVRRISKVTDIITTVAGNGVAGGLSGDGDGGPATSAKITPYYLAVDAVGNIYVSDALYGHVRRVDTAGIITTVAGSADTALGDGGPATSANINQPMGVVTGLMGTLYIADEGHSRIRRVTGLPYTVQLCAGTAVVVADSGLWVSTAPAIASASGPGIITGATPGAATLTCTSGADTLATINVVVDSLPMAGTISGTDSVCPGDTLSFTLAGALAGGLWSVADTLHATLLSPDMVKGIAPGSDAVLYTVNNGQCSNAAILAFTVRSLASCGDTVVPSSVATLAAGSTAISIYPNPNTGTFTIAGTWAVAGDMAATITITDVLGHTIYRTTAATTGGLMSARIAPATTLASGIYMVQLLRGAERSTVHFIVQ